MFSPDAIYVQVFADRLVVKNEDSGQSRQVQRDQSFASPRMLIADFTMAQYQLREAVKSVRRGLRKPEVLIHPMERCREVVTIKPVSLSLEEPRNWEHGFNVFDVSCNSNVRMRWTGNSEFVITFSVKGRDGGASSYFKPVDRTGKVHVSFNVEA